MSEQPDAQKELPPEIREFLIDKLAEILVLDYYHVHSPAPTDGAPAPQQGQPKPMNEG